MPHVFIDPNTTQCPDYTLDIYQAARASLVNDNVTYKQAAVILTNVWTAQNAVERQQWQKQVDQDDAAAKQHRQDLQYERKPRQEEIAKEKEDQRKEEMKKNKSKFIPIPARGVPTQPPVIASAFAIRRMDKGDFVPLWYYTNAGIDDAIKSFSNDSVIDDEALSLITRSDGSTSILPLASVKGSKGIVEDQDISWDDFCISAPRMIEAMGRAGWPDDRIKMMGQFWTNIQSHPFRSSRDPFDRLALLVYQAEQRRQWHQTINIPGYGYNLSKINEDLLRQTRERLCWAEHDRKDKEAERLVSPSISCSRSLDHAN
jgi:hypothetical protein